MTIRTVATSGTNEHHTITKEKHRMTALSNEFLIGLRNLVDAELESRNGTDEPGTLSGVNAKDEAVAKAEKKGKDKKAEKSAPAEKPAKGKKAKKAEPEPEAEEETDEAEESSALVARRAELTKTDIRTLRKQAIAAGYDVDAVKEAAKPDLVETLLAEEFGGESDEAEEEESEEETEVDENDRDYLEGLSLPEIKAVAKKNGHKAAALKGLDQAAIVDLILGEDDEEEDDADEAEEEAEEGSEDDWYTEAELKAMDIDELRELADEYGIAYKKTAKKATLVKLLVEEDEEEED